MCSMYEKYGSRGLEVLAFPCNQFAAEEPGSNDDIKKFVKVMNPYLVDQVLQSYTRCTTRY